MRGILEQQRAPEKGAGGIHSAQRPLLVSAADAAAMLGIGRTSFYALVREGVFAPLRIGRSVRFPVHELEAYVAGLVDSRDARAS